MNINSIIKNLLFFGLGILNATLVLAALKLILSLLVSPDTLSHVDQILYYIYESILYSLGQIIIYATPYLRKLEERVPLKINFNANLTRNSTFKNMLLVLGALIFCIMFFIFFIIKIITIVAPKTGIYKLLERWEKLKYIGIIFYLLKKFYAIMIELIVIIGYTILRVVDEILGFLYTRYIEISSQDEYGNNIYTLNLKRVIKDLLSLFILYKTIKFVNSFSFIQNIILIISNVFTTIKEIFIGAKNETLSQIQKGHNVFLEQIMRMVKYSINLQKNEDLIMFGKTQVMIKAREIKYRISKAVRQMRELNFATTSKIRPESNYNPFLNPVPFFKEPPIAVETVTTTVHRKAANELLQKSSRIQLPNTGTLHKFIQDFPRLKPVISGAIATGAFLSHMRKHMKPTPHLQEAQPAMPELGSWSTKWPERLSKALETALPNPNAPSTPRTGFGHIPTPIPPVDINLEFERRQ